MATWFLQLTHGLTPIHNGAGQGLGAIDRPIIREVTTGYPYLQSDSIKGAWRAEALAGADDAKKKITYAAVGEGETSGYQGCVAFQDAHLLAFPVRSLAGTFALATSRLALARLHRWLTIAGCRGGLPMHLRTVIEKSALLDAPGSVEALGSSKPPAVRKKEEDWDKEIVIDTGSANASAPAYVLEGFVLAQAKGVDEAAARAALASAADGLANLLFDEPDDKGGNDGDFWHKAFRSRLLVVPGDVFKHLVTHATQVDPNIKIGERNVTESGSLRYSEYLPAETILVNLLHAQAPLSHNGVSEAEVIDLIGKLGNRACYQIGADESKGAGIVRSRVWSVEEVAKAIPVDTAEPQPPGDRQGGGA